MAALATENYLGHLYMHCLTLVFLGQLTAEDPLMHFVDQLSIDLDSFSTNLFGGLCRQEMP